jgi:hypothetical protein
LRVSFGAISARSGLRVRRSSWRGGERERDGADGHRGAPEVLVRRGAGDLDAAADQQHGDLDARDHGLGERDLEGAGAALDGELAVLDDALALDDQAAGLVEGRAQQDRRLLAGLVAALVGHQVDARWSWSQTTASLPYT